MRAFDTPYAVCKGVWHSLQWSSFARHLASARSWRLRGTAMRFTVYGRALTGRALAGRDLEASMIKGELRFG